MTKRKIGQVNMLSTVHTYLNLNITLLMLVPALVADFELFRAGYSALGLSSEETKKKTEGITIDKKEQKKRLAAAVAASAGQAHAWAFTHGDNELMKSMDYSESQLLAMGSDGMSKTCGLIISQIKNKNQDLGTHRFPETELDALDELLAAFEGKVPAPRIAVASRSSSLKATNKQVQYLIKLLDESIDRLMLKFKFTHPAFYNTYVASREIVDIGSRETKMTGIIMDSTTGAALHKAVVTAVEVNNKFRFETTTNTKGIYTLKITEPGTYKLVVSHPQYKGSVEKLIDITLGSQARENIGLQPAA